MFRKLLPGRGDCPRYSEPQRFWDKVFLLTLIVAWCGWLALIGPIPKVGYRPASFDASTAGRASAPIELAIRWHPTAAKPAAGSAPIVATNACMAIDQPAVR
jgi:hypothetical protein